MAKKLLPQSTLKVLIVPYNPKTILTENKNQYYIRPCNIEPAIDYPAVTVLKIYKNLYCICMGGATPKWNFKNMYLYMVFVKVWVVRKIL